MKNSFAKRYKEDMMYHPVDKLYRHLDEFPIKFNYAGKEYSGFGGFVRCDNEYLTEKVTLYMKTVLRHPDIPAKFIVESVVYPTERAKECVVFIENDSDTDTALFSDIRYEYNFAGEHPVVKSIGGDISANYTPYEKDLTLLGRIEDISASGRPTHVTFPYYNLCFGENGCFIAIGWSGTWHASFEYNKETKKTHFVAGQLDVFTVLHAGETFRLPRIAIVEYNGMNSDEQTNVWRHYYLNDVMPKRSGKTMPTFTGALADISQGRTTETYMTALEELSKNGAETECLWIDAGWYTGAEGEFVSWPSTGTLDMDKNRFPDEMSEIGKYAAEHNMDFLLWFEPEVVRLDREKFVANQEGFKDEWLLDATYQGTWLEGYIVNLGNPECREWIFNKICKIIDRAGVTAYRQDFNNDPAGAWRAADASDRRGMTENLYVQGYYALWDSILERYPDIWLDSCASGGGRNDLETLKRSVILQYTDWFDGQYRDVDMKSRMMQSLFAFFPYFRNYNSVYPIKPANYRLNFCTYYTPFNYFMFKGLEEKGEVDVEDTWAQVRAALAEYQRIREFFYADYYQLIDYTVAPDRWNGWEFYDPDKKAGFASIYCLETSSTLSRNVKLKGLDPETIYTVEDFDGLVSVSASGKELCEKGIDITLPEKPYCAILMIKG